MLNEPLAAELGLDPDWLRSRRRRCASSSATRAARRRAPVAQAYAGHQFGGFVPRLGDGRALLLGELDDRRRARAATCTSRARAARRSPAAATGWPRSARCCASTSSARRCTRSASRPPARWPWSRPAATVRRETLLPGAVLARVASSHLRVGSFQYARATGDLGLLRRLADHAIARHHPTAAQAPVPALALFEAVVAAQASLVAQWMLVGFVHGVMNTDNTTISGETIDYGPCAFLDAFDPATVFSSIDEGGRYAYGNQPVVAEWNLARLAEALLPLLADDEEQAIARRGRGARRVPRPVLRGLARPACAAKLGLPDGRRRRRRRAARRGPAAAAAGRPRRPHRRSSAALGAAARGDAEPVRGAGPRPRRRRRLARALARRCRPTATPLDRVNPVYVPRNHLVEEALAAAVGGDLAPLERLLEAVTAPFDERPGLERYAEPAPEHFGAYRTFCGT